MKFFDLNKQYQQLSIKLNSEIKKNLFKTDFIQGKNVKILEKKLLNYTLSKYSLSCANGTDAIKIAIKSLNLKKNTHIIVPSYTWISTASSVVECGLIPLFCDVDFESFVITDKLLKNCFKFARKKKLKVSALISVDLFGNPVDYNSLKKICKKEKIFFISDAAQSFGSMYKGKFVGSKHCDVLTTSFFPTKTLGCYGDGGAVFFNNINNYIKGKIFAKNGQYKNKLISSGINSRLDTLQATILLCKLKLFEKENFLRRKLFQIYYENLDKNKFVLQKISKHSKSAISVLTIKIKKEIKRKQLINILKLNKIPHKIYYSPPLHASNFYNKYPKTNMDNTSKLAKQTLSLPIHSYLSQGNVKKICKMVNKIVR
jgi:UDP-2-acetamido-2-deoxy-ribo-hexuluronate aminotransferase